MTRQQAGGYISGYSVEGRPGPEIDPSVRHSDGGSRLFARRAITGRAGVRSRVRLAVDDDLRHRLPRVPDEKRWQAVQGARVWSMGLSQRLKNATPADPQFFRKKSLPSLFNDR